MRRAAEILLEGGEGPVRGLQEVGVEGVEVVQGQRVRGVRGVGGMRTGGQHRVGLSGCRGQGDSTAIRAE